jgi:hypothetical protein
VDGRTLTAVASEAAAQAAAIALPTSAGVMRWELPAMVEARYIKLGHKNTSAVAYTVYEFYPRRLIEGDDIRGESITALNIKASSITADRMSVTQLSALAADMGTITAGTITGATIQTASSGERIVMNSSTLTSYDASSVAQVTIAGGSGGKLSAGAGAVTLDSTGIAFTVPTAFADANMLKWRIGTANIGGMYVLDIGGAQQQTWLLHNSQTTRTALMTIQTQAFGSSKSSQILLSAQSLSYGTVEIQLNATAAGKAIVLDATSISVTGGLNVGSTATGAANGEVVASGQFTAALSDSGTTTVPVGMNLKHTSSGTPAAGFGVSQKMQLKSSTTADQDASQVNTVWATATHASRAARVEHYIYDSGGARLFLAGEASGSAAKIGFLGAAPVVRQLGGATSAGATYGANEQAMLDRAFQALRVFGLIT